MRALHGLHQTPDSAQGWSNVVDSALPCFCIKHRAGECLKVCSSRLISDAVDYPIPLHTAHLYRAAGFLAFSLAGKRGESLVEDVQFFVSILIFHRTIFCETPPPTRYLHIKNSNRENVRNIIPAPITFSPTHAFTQIQLFYSLFSWHR